MKIRAAEFSICLMLSSVGDQQEICHKSINIVNVICTDDKEYHLSNASKKLTYMLSWIETQHFR